MSGTKLSNADFLKLLNEAGIYTIEQLQTAGQASVHWLNITNKEEYVNSLISLTDTPSNYDGATTYKLVVNATGDGIEFIPDTTDGEDGTDGREVELQKGTTHIQWRYVGETEWNDLVALDDITGPQGDQGVQGEQGIQGIQGSAGADGEDGVNGTDGKEIRATDTEPTSEIGNDYDLRLLITNWDIYEKDPVDGWAVIGNIKGEQGDAGTNGTDGADGDIYYTTSTDTIDLNEYSAGHEIDVVVESGLAYSKNQIVVVSNSTSLYFVAKVINYSDSTLTLEVKYRYGTSSASSWEVNLAGIQESELNSDWFIITATAGTGTLASRSFTGPNGWTIGAANSVACSDLPGSSEDDLRLKHDSGLAVVDTIVYVQESTYNTKATGTRAYGTLYEDQNHNCIQLSSFCTESKPLIIYVKLQ